MKKIPIFQRSTPEETSIEAPWRRWLGAIVRPIEEEKRRLLEERWQALPEELQKPWQVVGQSFTHCGYVMGPSYCSFGCTHCYLPTNANRAPLPSFDEMCRQIDANRAQLGHGGNLQITGGDVVDAYWRAGRPDELIHVVRYAVDAGLVPMVMTHGQKLLENPDFLDRLIVEGKLRKLAIHIDLTQVGRPGFPAREVRAESDLHPLRQQFVDLILACRARTGVSFSAAHTLTVTSRNLGQVADVVGWLLADEDRLRAFRMVSLQPEADVGRTRKTAPDSQAAVPAPATPEACWEQVEKAIGFEIGRDNLWFGDPACSRLTTLLVLGSERRCIDALPSDPRSRAIRDEVRRVFGGVGARGSDRLEATLRRVSLLVRHPGLIWRLLTYLDHRLSQEKVGRWKALRLLATGRLGVLNIVQHNFMDGAQVREGGPEVERRLAACSFRGAVEENGQWRAVPMCELNAGQREKLYARAIDGL